MSFLINIFTEISSFLAVLALIAGAAAFVALRAKISGYAADYLVTKIIPEPAPVKIEAPEYTGFLDKLKHRLPDLVEQSVLQKAKEQQVSYRVRQGFAKLLITMLFSVLIALIVFLLGYFLTFIGLMRPAALGFVVRLVLLGIFFQNTFKAVHNFRNRTPGSGGNTPSLKELYRKYGVNFFKFIEEQISLAVYRDAYKEILATVNSQNILARFIYQTCGSGTEYYARAISEKALEHNRTCVRLLVCLAITAFLCYYAVLTFLIAPLVQKSSGEIFFVFVFLRPLISTWEVIAEHPAFCLISTGIALIIYHIHKHIVDMLRPLWKKISDGCKNGAEKKLAEFKERSESGKCREKQQNR